MEEVFHRCRIVTIIEEPCCSKAVQGPEMTVDVTCADGEVTFVFYLPDGHVRFRPEKKVVVLPADKKPEIANLMRAVYFALAENDLQVLLLEVATKFKLRDSWIPPPRPAELAQALPN